MLQYNITYTYWEHVLETCFLLESNQKKFRIPVKTRRVTLTKNCGESAYQATYKAYLKSMLQPRHLGIPIERKYASQKQTN